MMCTFKRLATDTVDYFGFLPIKKDIEFNNCRIRVLDSYDIDYKKIRNIMNSNWFIYPEAILS